MSVFEHLARDDAREQERLSGNRAIIAAQARVQDRFASFVANAAGPEDRDARLGLLDDEIREVVAAVCDEYGCEDTDIVHTAALEALGAGHPAGCDCGFCKNKGKLPGSDKELKDEEEPTTSSGSGPFYDDDVIEKKSASDYPGHDYSVEGGEYVKDWNPEEDQEADPTETSTDKGAWHDAKVAMQTVSMFHEADGFAHCDCNCEGCSSGGAHCESDQCISTKHSGDGQNASGEKTSASVETGDTFTSETFDLGSSSGKDGVQDVGSPKIDKSQVPGGSGIPGEGGLSAIDVPSKQHPTEQQDMTDTPDYWEAPIGPSETGKSIDAQEGLAPELYAGDDTKTWSGTEGQAAPVTETSLNSFSAKVAKWQVVNS